MIDLTKDALLEGIKGSLRRFDLRDFTLNYRGSVPNYREAINKIRDCSDYTASDISRVKKVVKAVVTRNIGSLVRDAEIDNDWLVENLGVGVIQTIGGIPEKALKTLESDVIEAITNCCVNTVCSAHYSPLPYTVNMVRMLLVYTFLESYTSEIRHRLKAEYDYSSRADNSLASMEISKADRKISELENLGAYKKKMLSYLTELEAHAKDQKQVERILDKLATSRRIVSGGFDSDIRSYQNRGSNLPFIADRTRVVGGIEYRDMMVMCVWCKYTNQYVYLHDNPYKENHPSEWELCYSILAIPVFAVHNLQTGAWSVAVSKDISPIDTYLTRCISSQRNISKFGTLDKSYKDFEKEIVSMLFNIVGRYNFSSFVDKSTHTMLLNALANASLV